MNRAIRRYLILLGMLFAASWFFWNPLGWKFSWQPIGLFLTFLVAYIGLDIANKKYPYTGYKNDVSLFKKLQELLPSNCSIAFIKTHDFSVSFSSSYIKPLFLFVLDWDNAEHEFIDRELEQKRVKFFEAAVVFADRISNKTSPISSGLHSAMPANYNVNTGIPDWAERDIKELNETAGVLVEAYQSLIRVGRKKLDLS